MNYIKLYPVGAILGLMLFLPTGCSRNDAQQAQSVEEKGQIEQMTDEAAEEAVKKIRTPINKARSTKDLGDDRMETMDKALQQQ